MNTVHIAQTVLQFYFSCPHFYKLQNMCIFSDKKYMQYISHRD